MTEIDPRALRNAFGAFMTGVTVVTTHDQDGNPLGFTANSFTSVSLDPPLVLVCLANSSRNYDAFNDATGFAVNILAEDQKEVSNTFARPVDDRFAAVEWKNGPQGSPVFEGVSAWFDCTMFNRVEAGDHLILIGEVKAFENNTHPGLGYARGAYVTPAAEAEALSNSANLVVSALIEYEGKVLLSGNDAGKLTLPEMKVGKEGATETLKRLIAAAGVTAEPGFIYSVYEDEARETQHISFLCQASGDAASQGMFTELSETTLMDIADPVVCTMLERFAQESQMGNFGVYYGNQVSGEVRPLTSRS
ncbi:flavin reductase [Halocynthiibacter sp.]|uniref:flavin reductase n=1 Tax=Halocynthiibacter sp. TaxID=1979210 RepID=UPI003C538459